MKGYVMNTSSVWTHSMKRSVGPGAKIPLDELYDQYGVKHDLKEGQDFIEWLRNVKLKDSKKWRIVVEDENVVVEGVTDAKEILDDIQKTTKKVDNVAPMVESKITIADVVGLSVRQAREVVPKINDLNLLKYAFQEANQLSGKDSLCKVIRKRIKDIQIAR
jgi:hypothetical protein